MLNGRHKTKIYTLCDNEKETTYWEKIFAKCISKVRFICRIYKKFSQLNNKTTHFKK